MRRSLARRRRAAHAEYRGDLVAILAATRPDSPYRALYQQAARDYYTHAAHLSDQPKGAPK